MTAFHMKFDIKAPFDRIWDTLLEDMEHPEKFSATIKEAKVLERFPGGLLREVSVPDADVREKIVFDYPNKQITSSLVGHPQIVGVIKKTLTKAEDPECWTLESSLSWESIDEKVDAMLRRNVASFVRERLERVKEVCEESSP